MSSSSSSSERFPYEPPIVLPPDPSVSSGNRFWNKAKENPLVPIGCLATAGALTVGLASFTRGSSVSSGNMMKLRVLAQGGTVAGLVGGIALAAKSTTNSSSSSDRR